jgi:GH15 family glucan-1,4-alpha-glucosidase
VSEFPDIGSYAFLSDCETNALVAPSGQVEWLCVPRPDSASIFGALLDRSAGLFGFGPGGVEAPSQRRYIPGTMVLETTWHTPTGWLVVTDALVVGPWRGGPRSDRYQRVPSDRVAQGVLVRTATCIEGRADVLLNCLPLFDYGAAPGQWGYQGEDYAHVVATAPAPGPDLHLTSDLRLALAGPRCYGHTVLHQGENAFAALSWHADPPSDYSEAAAQQAATTTFWREWLSPARLPDHPWRPFLERSALTLKGLSYEPTGAILAAATTSLPETPGGSRNWDYRYTWVRDSAFMLRALLRLGFEWEAIQYFAFLVEAALGGSIQIMYGLGGERDLPERTLDHLSGYRNARPVRVGNGAFDQRQHDVWGMILDSVYIHARHQGTQMGPAGWNGVVQLVEAAVEHWPQPDRGIWEIRGEPQHFTASKVMCWVAADRGAKLAAARGDEERAARWRQTAKEIHADVCAHGVDGRGVFTQCYGSTGLDASALLIPLMGFLPPGDDRVRATVLAIADELSDEGLVLRYRVEATDDGLEGDEGTFTICSFWLVSALALIGERQRAHSLCEKLLSLASPLHLYAEELAAASGQHMGNYPQAFTHLALIDAVTQLIELETAEAARGAAPPGDTGPPGVAGRPGR